MKFYPILTYILLGISSCSVETEKSETTAMDTIQLVGYYAAKHSDYKRSNWTVIFRHPENDTSALFFKLHESTEMKVQSLPESDHPLFIQASGAEIDTLDLMNGIFALRPDSTVLDIEVWRDYGETGVILNTIVYDKEGDSLVHFYKTLSGLYRVGQSRKQIE